MSASPAYLRDRYWSLKRLGLCTQCGREDRVEGRARCPRCLAMSRKYAQEPTKRMWGGRCHPNHPGGRNEPLDTQDEAKANQTPKGE